MILASNWIENLPPQPGPDMNPDLQDAIAELVDSLPVEYKRIVEAIAYERLSYREAAEQLGYKAHSQVYYKYQEALEMLEAEIFGRFG